MKLFQVWTTSFFIALIFGIICLGVKFLTSKSHKIYDFDINTVWKFIFCLSVKKKVIGELPIYNLEETFKKFINIFSSQIKREKRKSVRKKEIYINNGWNMIFSLINKGNFKRAIGVCWIFFTKMVLIACNLLWSVQVTSLLPF